MAKLEQIASTFDVLVTIILKLKYQNKNIGYDLCFLSIRVKSEKKNKSTKNS
jgi:hypothetical protein